MHVEKGKKKTDKPGSTTFRFPIRPTKVKMGLTLFCVCVQKSEIAALEVICKINHIIRFDSVIALM